MSKGKNQHVFSGIQSNHLGEIYGVACCKIAR